MDVQAAIPLTATRFSAAVTGSTQAFDGGSVQIDNTVTAPGVIDRVIRLRRH